MLSTNCLNSWDLVFVIIMTWFLFKENRLESHDYSYYWSSENYIFKHIMCKIPWKLTSIILTAPAFKCNLNSWLLTYIIDLHISPVWLHKTPQGYQILLTIYSIPFTAKVAQANSIFWQVSVHEVATAWNY